MNNEVRISRRDLLRWGIAGAVVGFLGRSYVEDQFNRLTSSYNDLLLNIPDSVNNTDQENTNSFYEPFAGKEANEIAKEMGVTAGTFFVVPSEIMPKLQGFWGNELFPIYTPAVLEWKNLIYKYAELNNIPPNILAMVMTIESAGRQDAVSGAGAQSLMQVMPNNFPSNLRTVKSMQDPDTNMKYGTEVFKYFLNYARIFYSNSLLPENDPRIIARALMGYNGGSAAVEGSVVPTVTGGTLAPDESAFYGDHIIRFVLTSEIASRLRNKGFADSEIIKQIQSEEVNGRAYVLKKSGYNNYSDYANVIKELSKPVLENHSLIQFINTYKNDKNLHFDYPTSPALMIWMRLGGAFLVSQEKLYTQNIDNWYKMNSQKQ
ncbi:MAG: transglycosylase SLT domain-containing protein [Candidatus Daviesbacteria bacterium]|nr:transglycosylase SLT domain-containing protein [Candidatus Daviesbacteria bacterium]